MDAALGGIAPGLRAHFAYRRFAEPEVRVLLLKPRYHVAAECEGALLALGHRVASVPVPGDGHASGDWLKAVLLAGARLRPDFVLSINHLGFDSRGVLAGLLDSLEVPTAAWYVDSPEFILMGTGANATPHVALFLWERRLTGEMRALGFQEPAWLPLAADSLRSPPEAGPAERPFAFVGDSMAGPIREWRDRVPRGLRPRSERAAGALADDRSTPRARLLDLCGAAGEGPDVRACALAYATLLATSRYRSRVLAALPRGDLHLFGDAGWSEVLPGAPWHGGADYALQTPRIYASTAVNLNATSLQMPTAVNQRVFDVPAAGGFLLTDDQADLQDLFPRGGELATYGSPEEARDRATWYRAHPRERVRVTEAARARISAAHTYRHRLAALVAEMRRRYAVRPGAAAMPAPP